jgi:hypothetical protein
MKTFNDLEFKLLPESKRFAAKLLLDNGWIVSVVDMTHHNKDHYGLDFVQPNGTIYMGFGNLWKVNPVEITKYIEKVQNF